MVTFRPYVIPFYYSSNFFDMWEKFFFLLIKNSDLDFNLFFKDFFYFEIVEKIFLILKEFSFQLNVDKKLYCSFVHKLKKEKICGFS